MKLNGDNFLPAAMFFLEPQLKFPLHVLTDCIDISSCSAKESTYDVLNLNFGLLDILSFVLCVYMNRPKLKNQIRKLNLHRPWTITK
jgi:hypothetical protein